MTEAACNILFIAWNDIRHQMRQGATLAWVFIMPPIFFYFIGTVTGGFSGGVAGSAASHLVVEAAAPGLLQSQIDMRLRENGFTPEWIGASPQTATETLVEPPPVSPKRRLQFSSDLTGAISAGAPVEATYSTTSSALARNYEILQVQRSVYTVLADVVAANARGGDSWNSATLQSLNDSPRIWQLQVKSAGKAKRIPSGFEQSIPGILVMFTLLVLLTSGASMLAIERNQGLLRRLASTPISRFEIVSGKWLGRMALAAIQIFAALAIGTWLFRMQWGPDIGMIAVILGAWAAFCASAGLLLGSIAKTENQAAGLGVLTANVLAALGGCWWPIEITPAWMQFIQKLLPTGWTMDALHKLISFGAGSAAALPHAFALLGGALLIAALAINRFRYE